MCRLRRASNSEARSRPRGRRALLALLMLASGIVASGTLHAQAQSQAPPTWVDDAAATLPPPGTELVTRRADVDAAIKARQWDRAEKLLADEIERVTPAAAGAGAGRAAEAASGGARAADLLKTLATIFLIDRKPLNAAVAIKKAEALGPIDEPTRFSLALAYISLQRGDWARPELEKLAATQPANNSYQYWLARLDYDAGQYAAAIRRLEEVVTRDPQFVRAFDNLGLCYEAQNQPEKAIARYREAVRLNRAAATKSPWPPLNLGTLLRRRGELVEAESLLKEAISYQRGASGTGSASGIGIGNASERADRDLARAKYELGVLLEQRQRWNEAIGELAGAVQADPTYPEPHYVLARIYRRGNRPDQADESLATFKRLRAASYLNRARMFQERAAEDPQAGTKAIEVYRELLAIDPENLEALYQSAFLLALQGKFAESRALIDRLPTEARDRPQALAVLTVDLVGQGEANSAAASSVAARLAAHPDLAAADIIAILPAFAHVPGEALDAADAIAQQLLQALVTRHLASAQEVQQHSIPLLMSLARAAYKSGKPKAALGYLAHARDLDPRNAGVHFFFGVACIDLNLGAEAYESLKKAVALDPENPFINYALGAVSIQRHDASESLPYFETYVRLKPDDPRGRFALGAARFYSNQLEAARTDLQQAAAHPETAAGAHYFLGRIARQLNDTDTARAELDLALRANPRYADAWAELGLVQTRMGQYAEAERSLTKALAIDPHHYAATFNLSTLYSKTKDPRRDQQAARVSALQEQRAAQAQEFLRIIEVTP
jgi:tetratricopeptide (TPR) repeat protein